LSQGHGAVYLPNALSVKYPNAGRQWGWQYVFPSRSLSVDPRSGVVRRHHVDDRVLSIRAGSKMSLRSEKMQKSAFPVKLTAGLAWSNGLAIEDSGGKKAGQFSLSPESQTANLSCYSNRKAVMGSTRVARWAGRKEASNATRASSSGTPTKIKVSRGLTP